MKQNILILMTLCLGIVACKSKKIENRSIGFLLTTTSDYCGGAYPPEELIEELRAPKPYNGTIYVHKSENRQDDAILVIVKDGVCSITGLSEGTYYIHLAPLMMMPENLPFTKEAKERLDCQLKQNRTPNVSFPITKKTTKITQNIHIICDPCELPRP